MTILNGLIYGIILVVMTVGLVILTGCIIALINNLFYKLVGENSQKFCIATSIIGTPVHELGHALFCLIFGHKIVSIKLWDKDPKDDVLGYVNHAYNEKNIYQKLGNFFIGVGPIIIGSLVIVATMFIFSRECFNVFKAVMTFYVTEIPTDISYIPKFIFGGFFVFIENFFTYENTKLVGWWIFVIISMLISLHMRLSPADIKGASSGFWFSLIALFLLPIIASLFGFNIFSKVTGYMIGVALCFSCIYSLAVLLAACSIAIAFVYWIIRKIFRKA